MSRENWREIIRQSSLPFFLAELIFWEEKNEEHYGSYDLVIQRDRKSETIERTLNSYYSKEIVKQRRRKEIN